jgi:hypothetical protein
MQRVPEQGQGNGGAKARVPSRQALTKTGMVDDQHLTGNAGRRLRKDKAPLAARAAIKTGRNAIGLN